MSTRESGVPQSGGGEPATQCLNCEATLTGEYCANCGQKVGPARIGLKELARQLFEENFELDGRVPRTLVPFFFKPGFVTLEYNAGRKRSYTSPLRLFLASGVLWVLVAFAISQWQAFHPGASGPDMPPGLTLSMGEQGAAGEPEVVVDDPENPGALVEAVGLSDTSVGRVIQSHIDEFQALPNTTRNKRLRDAASDIPPTVAFALFPVFALFLKLIMLGSGRTLPEHAVFALHVHAFGLVVMSIVRAIGDDRVIVAGFAVFGLHVFFALRRAYELRWWPTIWRWSLLSLLFAIITSSVFATMLVGKAISG